MPPLLQFIVRRLFYAAMSLVILTLVLYAGFMLTPAEAWARLYAPSGRGGERVSEKYIQAIIRDKHLDAPFLIQYGYWVQSLLSAPNKTSLEAASLPPRTAAGAVLLGVLTGSWGYSPTLGEDVLPSLLRRTPATLELALYSCCC